MLETLKQTILINFTVSINSWIYFLKRVPLIKTAVKDVGYEHSKITKALYVMGIIYSMIKQLLKTIMLLTLGFGLPYLFIMDDIANLNKQAVYWQLFILFYLLLALPRSKILEPHRRKFICVKLMRMNARRFVISDYFPQLLWRQLIELILFAVTAHLFGVNILLALFLVTAKNLFAITAEVLQIKYYDKTGDFLHNKTLLNLTYTLIILSIGYYSAFIQYFVVIPAYIILILGAFLWIIGFFSFTFILNYSRFPIALGDANRLDKLSIDFQSAKKNAAFSRVKLKDKEFTVEELQYDKTNKKEGFAFLNEIFFKRHRRILNGPIIKQAVVITFLFLVGVILSIFIKDFNTEYIAGVKKLFPVFIYVLYMISTGQKATKAMFYNCDISLLHYGFYKTKDAVLATFTIRAKYLIFANMIPAGLLAVGIILLGAITGGSVQPLIPIGVMIIVLSIFFVIHNLFLYYIFQPFTTELNVKNPLYKLFQFITYILCYISLQLKNMSITFLIIVVGLTLIYSIAALITVYRIAPRTFIIK
jgi:hypothetical protein